MPSSDMCHVSTLQQSSWTVLVHLFYVTALVILGCMFPILQQKKSELVKYLALDLLKGPEGLGSRMELCLADTGRKSLACQVQARKFSNQVLQDW